MSANVSRPIINLLLIEKSMILLIIDLGVNSVKNEIVLSLRLHSGQAHKRNTPFEVF